MSQSSEVPTGGVCEPDKVVGDVISRPTDAGKFRVLTGYVGVSGQSGTCRIYRTLEFADFVQVEEGAIVHRASLASSEYPLAPSLLWVKGDAPLKFGFTGSEDPLLDAMFLKGGVSFLMRERSGGGDGGGGGTLVVKECETNADGCYPLSDRTCFFVEFSVVSGKRPC